MQKTRLGRTEAEVSAIGLGTWSYGGPRSVGGHQVGWSGHDDESARAALEHAFAAGINHWDTADVYGDGAAEALIGSIWDRVPRHEVFLASKVGWDNGGYSHQYHPHLVRDRIDRSLRLLRSEHIDLYYLHHCDFGPGDRHLEPALAALAAAREAGKIRFLGLSDWSCRKLARVARLMDPDVVQTYRNAADDDFAPSGLGDWASRRDAGVVFFSPLKHGLLLGKYGQPTDFATGDVRNSVPGFRSPSTIAALAAARRAVEKRFPNRPEPVLAALCGYLLHDCPSASVLVGLRNERQAAAAAHAGAPLSGADAAWMRELYSEMG